MAVIEVNWQPSRRELKQFAAIWFPLACAMIGLLIYKWTKSWYWPSILWGVAAPLAVLAFFVPEFSRRLYVGWMIGVFPIGWTISHLLMGLIYYVLITPMGLLMRACGRDSMGRRFQPERDSYWVPREEPKDSKQYFRQY